MNPPQRGLPLPRTDAQPPEEAITPEVTAPAESAGGVPAVLSATKIGLLEMGPLRTLETLSRVNQREGFDCPGCAWPDPTHRSAVEFCENGAKAVAWEATKKRITREFFAELSIPELAQRDDHWLEQQGRLTEPMVRRPGSDRYEPIAWAAAFELIARELNALASPDEAAFYTSGRTSNEAAFLYQLFVRSFGTNNLPDCSNMCHESSGTGLGQVIGIGKGTVKLEDFDSAGAIFVIGQNPGTNHPRMLTALQRAKRNGARIVAINPFREAGLLRFKHPQEVQGLLGSGTSLADLYLQVRIGGDVALLQGISKELLLLEQERPGQVLDRTFIEEHTLGFQELERSLAARSFAELEEAAGIPRDQMRAAARIYAEAKGVIVCWAMGLTQHQHGVANVQECVNLLLLGGNIGKPGAGACPVRGHSNVQGDRTVGIWEKPPPAFLDALERECGITAPRGHGLATVPAIHAMLSGHVKVFFALGGNFLSATPDTELTARALKRCRLTVQVSTKLNRSHLITGETALILPCLGRTERDQQATGEQVVSVENSMGFVHASRGRLTPAGRELRSEVAIVCELARAVLGPEHPVAWEALRDDYRQVRALLARVLPGFERYEERLAEGGFYLPNGPRERKFTTPSGKAHFTVHPVPSHELGPGELLMMTVRSHDQFNTSVYGYDDRYRGVYGERRVVFLNRDDVRDLGLREGQRVDLTSHFRGERRLARGFVVVPYDLPRRCAATYFPEANVLVPVDHVAERSLTPASKSVVITVSPAA
ncbi:MAG: FdhF/YdeP family oxidoreductase [Planctomycetota bacterium]